ncbi:MAG: DNA internalization-related competence protein ComEC/Rec2, partial [Thiotrichaceae bacterium]|nr:DNA internalization-related competence protein ComEC/Rec2 [Thiotrichaceae bacterium]
MALLYKFHNKIVSLSPAYYSLCFLILSAASGAVYTSLYLNFNKSTLDIKQWEGKTIQVIGIIDSIPYQTTTKQAFDFYIRAGKMPDHTQLDSWDYSFKGKVKLSWYDTAYKVKPINKLNNIPHDKGLKLAIGQLWQFDIRLKKPNGLMNPGGFDYEKWLYQNRILATGYVRDAQLISERESSSSLLSAFYNQLSLLRQKLANQLDASLIDYPYKGLIKALSIGYRHDMSAQQWKLFLQSGTNHLVAISGLHIGLMSSLVWLLVNTLWKSSSTLSLRVPAYYVASVFALIAAIIYAGLAGFAIPTQRALIMLCVVFVALMLKREISSSYILCLALFIVLIFDPLSPLAIGFWLSFAAVAIIIFSLSGRLNIGLGQLAKLWQLARMQVIIFVGLLPLMIIIFHHFSLTAPLANLLAVPLMSFIIVPITLLASALLFIFPSLALWLFELLQWPIDALFSYLENLTQLPENYYFLPEISLPVIILSFIACLWLLMPRGWPGRFLGVVLLLPAMLSPVMNRESDLIPEGEVKMTVLDVAQGLSIVLRTRTHTLVYDTGDKFSARFNMSDMVSIPYLRLQGLDEINKLVLSHSDRDHAGS